jgi:hypothetical protein
MGHLQTLRFASPMSALHSKADILQTRFPCPLSAISRHSLSGYGGQSLRFGEDRLPCSNQEVPPPG